MKKLEIPLPLLSVNMETVKEEQSDLLACRICLAWDVRLCPIRESGLDQMFSDVMGTSLSEWDGLPQHICSWCRAQLARALGLRARAQRACELLKQTLVHQDNITNEFIHTIDRTSHKLTHTLTTRVFNDDDIYYFNHDTQTHLFNTVIINNNEQLHDDVEDDNINDDLKNDIIQNSGSDSELVHGMVEINAEVNLVEKETEIKKVKSKRKRDGKKKKEIIEIIDKDIKINGKRLSRRKMKKQTDKVRKSKGKKHTFCTEEDFKEFEKKYDFQVQCLTEEEMEKEMEKRKESDKYLKGEYKCELCFKGFLTSVTYENHMKTHDPARGDHACRLCHARYQFPVKLRHHVQNTHRLKFRCARCNELVRGKACAVLHAAYHAGTTFKCAHCDKQFLKKTSRTSHMRMAHPAENAAGGTCEACGETFTSRTGLRAHKTRSHKKVNLPELKCRKCRTQFDNMEALKKHRSTYANKCHSSLSACSQCGETCASADDLILHAHTRHGVHLYTCDKCTKSFTSKTSLTTHIDRVHRLLRPPKADYSDGGRRSQPDWLHWASVCEHCGKRLSCLATLKIHMNKHTGERPYKCALCPKAYMTPYGLNNHQAFHTGVRKWQCPECPATFMHQSSVYQHRKIHTGERSHQCTICEKYFTQSGSLYTHVKYVHMKETPPPRKRNKKPVQQGTL
ncbi:zinc finger protein ZFP2-like [Leguminivora glycinivorella]|uniref:zinc finger protein ZFP2-like n=1 Tax=Leguminivora glycinivorella TaxID=1035111 RepID=UPI00200E5C08|nr:zinc finger protein ZFP2-like [Leguminivora glycinivorella]